MSRATITTADESYLVSPDDAVSAQGRFRSFVIGQARDKLTKRPLPVDVSVVVNEADFTVEIKEDNWFVIAGILRRQFPLLAVQSYQIHFTLSAPGYMPLAVMAKVPQTPTSNLPKVVELKPADTEMVLKP